MEWLTLLDTKNWRYLENLVVISEHSSWRLSGLCTTCQMYRELTDADASTEVFRGICDQQIPSNRYIALRLSGVSRRVSGGQRKESSKLCQRLEAFPDLRLRIHLEHHTVHFLSGLWDESVFVDVVVEGPSQAEENTEGRRPSTSRAMEHALDACDKSLASFVAR